MADREKGTTMAEDEESGHAEPRERPKRSKSSKRTKSKRRRAKGGGRPAAAGASSFPRHAVRKALRVPRAILDQNAGKACSDREAAGFCGVKVSGPFGVEISSALKYGFLRRPEPGQVEVTDLAKKVLRPQSASDEIDGLREAVQTAPILGEVYKHYRGENIPDDQFFRNALTDTFRIPDAKVEELGRCSTRVSRTLSSWRM
jgi:hypothetical protein